MFFTLSEALRPRESVNNTVFCSCLERKPCPKPSLDGDQYSLTVKQVSTFCAFPAVRTVEKHSVFQCLRKTGPKLGPMLGGGVPPRAELCFWNLPAHCGLIHKGEKHPSPRVGATQSLFGPLCRIYTLSRHSRPPGTPSRSFISFPSKS